MPRSRFRVLAGALLFFAFPTQARELVLPQLSPARTSLSGTLVPFALVLDGIPLFESKEKAERILVEGEELNTEKAGNRAFFGETFEGGFQIEAFVAGAAEPFYRKQIELPRVLQVEVAEDQRAVIFALSPDVAQLSVDGAKLSVSEGRAAWAPPATAETDWRARLHSVELRGASDLERSYDLKFEVRHIHPHRFGLALCAPPGDLENGIQFAYERGYGKGWHTGFLYRYGNGKVYHPSGSEEEIGNALFFRVGWQLWDASDRVWDSKRLQAGLTAGWIQLRQTQNYTYAYSTPNRIYQIHNYLRLGVYARWEPFQIRRVGLAIAFDYLNSSRYFAGGGPRPAIELSYHWD